MIARVMACSGVRTMALRHESACGPWGIQRDASRRLRLALRGVGDGVRFDAALDATLHPPGYGPDPSRAVFGTDEWRRAVADRGSPAESKKASSTMSGAAGRPLAGVDSP
jgi:hypothetical protein